MQKSMNHRLGLLTLLLAVAASAIGQRLEYPPNWAVGNFVGRNDHRKVDVDLTINRDGKATLTYRVNTIVQTFRGEYDRGRLVFNKELFLLRSVDNRTIEITNQSNRRDTARLTRRGDNPGPIPPQLPGGAINLLEPRNNARYSPGQVTIAGTTGEREVRVEIFRGPTRVFERNVRVRGDRFEFTTGLSIGQYELTVRPRDGRGGERRIRFEIRGRNASQLGVDRPVPNERVNPGVVEFSGTTDAEEVQIEIFRGRDRVFVEQTKSRDERFVSKINLGPGRYEAVVQAKEDGRPVATRRFSFDVGRAGGVELEIRKPTRNMRYTNSNVDFEGESDYDMVRIEIYQGRDRVFGEEVRVRDGRFRSRAQLPRGRYEVRVSGLRGGRGQAERRMPFEVDIRE